MNILVINAGSTSLKFGLYEAATMAELAQGHLDWADGNRQNARMSVRLGDAGAIRSSVAVPTYAAATEKAIQSVSARFAIDGVGHRVVHGGAKFCGNVLINKSVKQAIAELGELAPLHNPPALAAIEAAEKELPEVPQAAVFDTAFFAQLPPKAYVYPLPYEWLERWGVRRIGFHGISNAYCAQRIRELMQDIAHPIPAKTRLITCHLGGGCSATAVVDGCPVATTMGFSPLEGLIMGTRCGSVDPGLLLHLQRHCGLSLAELDHAMNHASGLLGISGISPDLAQIEAAARDGHARAQLAFDLFADRVRSAIGSLAVTMGGLDALVFTDRIGEGSPALRAAVCTGLECLGAHLDPSRNRACAPDMDVSSASSAVRVWVIHTQEEIMIARACRPLFGWE